MPTAVEVDPETPLPVEPFRFVPIAPSLAGLPLRLACALVFGSVAVLLAELLLADAFDRIHTPALAELRLVADADAVADGLCPMPLPGMMHPVNVICCAALVERDDGDVRLRGVVVCPLRLEGDDVVGWVPDVCG